MSRLRIEKYSRKPLVGRRQYAARIVASRNGEIIWRTSESYNNRGDRDWAVSMLDTPALQHAIVLDLDDVKGAEIEL